MGEGISRKEFGKNAEQLRHVDIAKLDEIVQELAVIIKRDDNSYIKDSRYARKVAEIGETFPFKFLVQFNISFTRIGKSLISADTNFIPIHDIMDRGLISPQYILSTMRQMLKLETAAPGSVKFLYEQRGIRNFARFDAMFWKRQYNERESPLPYMITILPSPLEEDFLSETKVYTKLQNNLKRLSSPHIMRVIEINGIQDGLRILHRLDSKYNSHGDNPIKLVLYDGHGLPTRLYTGEPYFKAVDLNTLKFKEIFNKYLYKTFSPSVQIILGSCEAAGEGEKNPLSIAVMLKETLHDIFSKKVRVVASTETVTQFAELAPSLGKNGKLSLNVKSVPYDDENKNITARYRAM